MCGSISGFLDYRLLSSSSFFLLLSFFLLIFSLISSFFFSYCRNFISSSFRYFLKYFFPLSSFSTFLLLIFLSCLSFQTHQTKVVKDVSLKHHRQLQKRRMQMLMKMMMIIFSKVKNRCTILVWWFSPQGFIQGVHFTLDTRWLCIQSRWPLSSPCRGREGREKKEERERRRERMRMWREREWECENVRERDRKRRGRMWNGMKIFDHNFLRFDFLAD